MNRLSDYLFAAATFTADQHRRIGNGDPPKQLAQLYDAGMFTDQGLSGDRAADGFVKFQLRWHLPGPHPEVRIFTTGVERLSRSHTQTQVGHQRRYF